VIFCVDAVAWAATVGCAALAAADVGALAGAVVGALAGALVGAAGAGAELQLAMIGDTAAAATTPAIPRNKPRRLVD
jgi:hypothetical protein